MQKLWREFLRFIMSGNLIMLAVAFILAIAVTNVVNAFIQGIVQPFIGAIVGKPTFDNTFKIGKGVIQYGTFITALINLAITGAVLFAIVKGYEAYRARRARGEEPPEEPTEDVTLLREIRDLLAARAQ